MDYPDSPCSSSLQRLAFCLPTSLRRPQWNNAAVPGVPFRHFAAGEVADEDLYRSAFSLLQFAHTGAMCFPKWILEQVTVPSVEFGLSRVSLVPERLPCARCCLIPFPVFSSASVSLCVSFLIFTLGQRIALDLRAC